MSLASYHCSTPGCVLPLLWTFPRLASLLLPLPAAVTAEHAGGGELAEFVADHVLGDVHLDELLAVVNQERVADEVGDDRGVPRPGLEWFAVSAALALDLGEQPHIDVRTTVFQFLGPTHATNPCRKDLL